MGHCRQAEGTLSNGDHADHEMVLLADGTAVAIGFKSFTAGHVCIYATYLNHFPN